MKPSCPICGGSMTRVAHGGERRDPETNKWVPSRQESWRCNTAWEAYQRDRREAIAAVEAEHGDHVRWLRVDLSYHALSREPQLFECAPVGPTCEVRP